MCAVGRSLAIRLPAPARNQSRRRARAMSSFSRVNRANNGATVPSPAARHQNQAAADCLTAMQNAARVHDTGTRHHRDLVDHSTFTAAGLRAARLPRLALACRSLTAAQMKRDVAAVSENRRQSSWAVGPPRSMKIGYHARAVARATSRELGTGEVRRQSDVGAFGAPHCRVRARRAESCRGKLL